MKIPNLDAIKDWLLSKIINNMMVTEPGFFMDARQGPVIQGEIDEVKNGLSEVTSKLNDYVKLVTSDNIAISLGSRASAEYKATFTIPKGYKRLDLMWFNSSGAVFCSGRYTFTQNSVSLWLINLSDYDISVTGNAILLCIRE